LEDKCIEIVEPAAKAAAVYVSNMILDTALLYPASTVLAPIVLANFVALSPRTAAIVFSFVGINY
jgi:hypothetical protein